MVSYVSYKYRINKKYLGTAGVDLYLRLRSGNKFAF